MGGDVDLSVDIAPGRAGTLALRNPVMVAGPVGYGRELARQADLSGLGALVTRVTTLQRRAGSSPPRLAGTPAGALMGQAPNPGLRAVLREHAAAWAAWPLPVILAVAGQSAGEYARIGAQVEGEPGVAGLELDLSAPPEPGRPAAGWDPAEAWQLVHAMREACSLPLLARLPWSGPLLVEVARAAILAGADALTLIAPLPGLLVDTRRRKVALAGDLAGPALLPLVLACLHEVHQALPEATLVAAGGIRTGEDAAACLLAGATAVQVDAALLGDPRAPLTVMAGLEAYCREMGITEIKAMVGTAR